MIMSHLSSMTAFAQATAVSNGYQISWELRSVNHRYLESQFRLPDTLSHRTDRRGVGPPAHKARQSRRDPKTRTRSFEPTLALNTELLRAD